MHYATNKTDVPLELVLPVMYGHYSAYGQKTIDGKFLIGAISTLESNRSYYTFSAILLSRFIRMQAMVSSCKQATSKILYKCKKFTEGNRLAAKMSRPNEAEYQSW